MSPTDSTTTWVRLQRDGVTVFLDRWPGPHGPDSAVYSTDLGWFLFDHVDVPTDGIAEHIYRPAAT